MYLLLLGYILNSVGGDKMATIIAIMCFLGCNYIVYKIGFGNGFDEAVSVHAKLNRKLDKKI